MNTLRSITLIPKEIHFNVYPIKKTIKCTDEDGVVRVKRNQLFVKVNFTGIYENEFVTGNILFDRANNVRYVAISRHAIAIAINELKSFTLPKEVEIIGSAYIETQNKPATLTPECKVDFDSIKSLVIKLKASNPFGAPEIKSGKLFYDMLYDANKDVLVDGVPFRETITNPELFGIKVILDETLPVDTARIGNDFFKLK